MPKKSLAAVVCQPKKLKRLLNVTKGLFCLSLSPPGESMIWKDRDLFFYPEELRCCWWLQCHSCAFHLQKVSVQTAQVV